MKARLLILAATLLLAACGEQKPVPFNATDVTATPVGRDFELTDPSGKKRRLSEFRARRGCCSSAIPIVPYQKITCRTFPYRFPLPGMVLAKDVRPDENPASGHSGKMQRTCLRKNIDRR